MNCDDIRPLLEAHADGELDLVRQVEIEAHLRACPACARQARAVAERRNALRASLPRFTAAPQFRTKILASIRAEAPVARRRSLIPWPVWNLGGLAAALIAALLLGYAAGDLHERQASLVEEAVADHVRSLQAGHLLDVVSTDQHTVKPWFIGKLDFSPPVVDLAAQGFPLTGGRLERLDGQNAAALVFHRRLHSINLFIWPAAHGTLANGTGERSGYHTASWSQAGLNFLAVSEIPAAELEQFAGAYRSQTR